MLTRHNQEKLTHLQKEVWSGHEASIIIISLTFDPHT